ncbi:MAG: retroviral-like aspartic protease family protein [Candidatus Omnitrophica bacterium]|nr:retroviral-like aspartic protease family protein [Candidatus Omnitrophota bacterium]
MRGREEIPFFLTAFLAMMFIVPAITSGDTIYLKNGRTMEGIVEREDEQYVILNVGFGTIRLTHNEIERIEHDDTSGRADLEREWEDKYFLRPEFTPLRLEGIARQFKRLEQYRNRASRNKRRRERVIDEIDTLEADVQRLYEALASLGKQLAVVVPEDDVKAYNALVGEHTFTHSQLQLKIKELEEIKKEIPSLDQAISEYMLALGELTQMIKDIYSHSTGELSKEEEQFLFRANKELENMHSDFTRFVVEYDKGREGVMVNVLLNGTIRTQLKVDTGADVVVISDQIASKFGTTLNRLPQNTFITVADGREVKVSPVIFDSVRVGDAEAKNVMGVILPPDARRDTDGLLGMSFLKHFMVRFDSKSKRLILEKFGR